MTQQKNKKTYPEFYSVLTSCYGCAGSDHILDDDDENDGSEKNDKNSHHNHEKTFKDLISAAAAATTTTTTISATMDTPMRRASMSRRQHPEENNISSPLVRRSRSQERIMENKGTESTTCTEEEEDNDTVASGSGGDGGYSSQYDDSERIGQRPVNRKTHRRSISDPFDAQEDAVSSKSFEQEDDDDSDDDDDDALVEVRMPPATTKTMTTASMTTTATAVVVDIMPTFPRYPVSETRNQNCYSEPPVSIFHVRGPTYFTNNKKVPSAPYLMTARGCDLFLTDSSSSSSSSSSLKKKKRVVAKLDDKDHLILGGQLRRKPTLAINFRFPWGYMCLYFEIPQSLTVYMNGNGNSASIDNSSLSPPERTLAAWLQGDDDYKNDRLKLIPYVAEGPWVVRNMVTGRPAIIGRKLPVSYQLKVSTATEAPLLTATLDIGSSSSTAKRIVSVCRRYMSALTVDIGFVIQAEDALELPEQMLGSIRVHHPDPLKAHKL